MTTTISNSIYAVPAASDLATIIREVEAAAAAQGLTLSRWQANKGRYSTTITYIIHSGERAAQARYQAPETVVASAVLNNHETPTKRGSAYAAMCDLLAALSAVEVAA